MLAQRLQTRGRRLDGRGRGLPLQNGGEEDRETHLSSPKTPSTELEGADDTDAKAKAHKLGEALLAISTTHHTCPRREPCWHRTR